MQYSGLHGGTWWYMVCLGGFLKEHRGLGLSTEINLYMHALSQPACCLHTHRVKINCVWYFILEIYSIPLRPACQWFCWDCCSFSYHFIATPAKHSLARKQYLGCACLSVCSHFLDQAFVCVVCIGDKHCRYLWIRHTGDDTEVEQSVIKQGTLWSSISYSWAVLLQLQWPGHRFTLHQIPFFLQQMGPLCYMNLFGV